MKKNQRNNRLYIVITLFILAACGQGREHAEHIDTYTCPMHPTIVFNRPGTCPICAMDLVRKARQGESVSITNDLASLINSPDESVVSSIKTIKGTFKSIPVLVEATGVVTYDTKNIYTIPSRVGGRLERIYLKYAFQQVVKGQKVAEIYSPELLTVQRELLFLLENDAENKSLLDAATSKLTLLGLTAAQINTLVTKREVNNTFSIYSPYNGYLIGDQAPPAAAMSPSTTTSSNSMSGGMGSPSSVASPSASAVQTGLTASFARQGNYVTSGQTLFSIVNTSALLIELNLPVAHAGAVKAGDTIMLYPGNGHRQQASIGLVQPFFTEGQDFLKIRVYTHSMKSLHIGHLVKATIRHQSTASLWVPKKAILDLGFDKVVFVKERGMLKPKRIATGIHTAVLVEVKSGLTTADEIAANAQYLVDSESFIKPLK